MSVSNVGQTASVGGLLRHEQQGRQNRHYEPGEKLSLRIVRKLDERHYLATFGGEQNVVESAVELSVGSRVQAAVAAVGEKLELRFVGVEQTIDHGTANPVPESGLIAALENKFATSFGHEQREQVEKAVTQATDANAMALGGVFLNKLALPLDAKSLTAVHDEQVWTNSTSIHAAGNLGGLLQEHADDADSVAERMRIALDASSTQAVAENAAVLTSSSGHSGDNEDHDRRSARELLNVQDGGSVNYSYGVLPLMIGDQLVELDLAYFRERRDAEPTEGVRRMVMTFSTRNLGHVEVLAQAIGDRLTINLKTDSAISSEVLAQHGEQLRELTTRLGWSVDSVTYGFDPNSARAARHIVEHVIQADTLSRFM